MYTNIVITVVGSLYNYRYIDIKAISTFN